MCFLIELMRFLKQHFFRFFVSLLASMLIANTVYAGGVMVSENFAQATQQHEAVKHEHAEHQHAQSKHADENADGAAHQTQSHANCKHCNHCLACFSMMMPSVFKLEAEASKSPLLIRYTFLYTSPTSPQLQRPPIA